MPEIAPSFSTELSDKETYLIGAVVSQWGFLEAEIFDQTLLSFEDTDELPKCMNNVQFTTVLDLWFERVVRAQSDDKREVLENQYQAIKELNDFRQAIVHSRWKWRPDRPDEITAVRVHKQSVKETTFKSDDLHDFSVRLGRIRFHVKYPGGLSERADELSQTGGYISRKGWDLLTGRTSLPDLAGPKS